MKNHIFLGCGASHSNVFFQGSTSKLVESSKGSTQNLPKYKIRWSRSSKLYHVVSFLEGTHQCQIDIVTVAVVICTLRASFCETTVIWHCSGSLVSFGESTNCGHTCHPAAGLRSRYPCVVQETFLAETCKVEADAWFLLRQCRCCSAILCKTHASVENIKPWQCKNALSS